MFDDGKRLWVPPVALQGLLPAVLLEGLRFWAEEKHGVVSFKGALRPLKALKRLKTCLERLETRLKSLEKALDSLGGEAFNPPVYSSLNYSIHVTCENGVARAGGSRNRRALT